ncbi:hypothetical protein [Abyssalbus ytuae]|uniref:Uncharacterized protein n=1 Tax=Abyssalbus ytuae TaxID=2926907 RepID=A0A9E7CV07_9FLAO|nr:hypothetical protein [Abyssalbus ytuae]UOB19227.1 hypothetical protein MQE35_07985 [Abyssalbus ytuae]
MNKEYPLVDKLNASGTAGYNAGRFLVNYLSYLLYFFIPLFINKLITVSFHRAIHYNFIYKKMFIDRTFSVSTFVVESFSTGMGYGRYSHTIPQEITNPPVNNQKAVAAYGSKGNSRFTLLTSLKASAFFNYPGVLISTSSFSIFPS